MRRLTALFVATVLALVISTGAAAAHAKLESMTPADGATVADPPKSVVLRFNEPVTSTGAELMITSPGGTVVSSGSPAVVDETVTQPLAALTEAGRYRVVGRVVSIDGHPITVTAAFTVTRPAQAGESASAAPPPDDTADASTPGAGTSDDGNSAQAVIVAMVLIMVVVVALAVVIVRRRPIPGPE